MLGSIFRSIVITLIITGAASAVAHLLGYNILKTSLLIFIGIVCVSIIGSYMRDGFIVINNKKLENDRIREFTKQGLNVNCALCSAENFIPIRLDNSNTFVCQSCDKENAVYINITTAQITTPLDTSPISITSFVEDKIEAENKIKNG